MTVEEPERQAPTPTGRGAWRTLEAALLALEPGEILTYEEMAALYGESVDDARAMGRIYGRLRTAAQHVLDSHQRVFRIVRGMGYQRAKVEGVIAQVQQHQSRALREVQMASTKICTVDPESLDAAQASLVRATRDSLASQLFLMRGRDVRRKDLATALAAATAPASVPGMPRAAVTTPAPQSGSRALMEQDFPAV